MEGTVVAEAEEVDFKTLALDHLFVGYVADAYLGKVGLSGNWAEGCELGAVESDPIVVLGVLVVKGLQYLWGIALLILGFSAQ